MSKTATAEQVKEQFITGDLTEAMKEIRKSLDGQWDTETAADMIVDIIDDLNTQAARENVTIDDWKPIDRMTWVVKEAYIRGFLQGFSVTMESNQMAYKDLFESE